MDLQVVSFSNPSSLHSQRERQQSYATCLGKSASSFPETLETGLFASHEKAPEVNSSAFSQRCSASLPFPATQCVSSADSRNSTNLTTKDDSVSLSLNNSGVFTGRDASTFALKPQQTLPNGVVHAGSRSAVPGVKLPASLPGNSFIMKEESASKPLSHPPEVAVYEVCEEDLNIHRQKLMRRLDTVSSPPPILSTKNSAPHFSIEKFQGSTVAHVADSFHQTDTALLLSNEVSSSEKAPNSSEVAPYRSTMVSGGDLPKEVIDKMDSSAETQSGEEENLSTDHSTETEKTFKADDSNNDVTFLGDSLSIPNASSSEASALRYAAKTWSNLSAGPNVYTPNQNDQCLIPTSSLPTTIAENFSWAGVSAESEAPLLSICQKSHPNSSVNGDGSLSDYTVSLQQHLAAWQSQLKDLHGREYDSSRPHGAGGSISTFPSIDTSGIHDLPVCMRTLMTLMLEMQRIQTSLIEVQQRLIDSQVHSSSKHGSPSACQCWEDLIQTALTSSPFTNTVLSSPPSLTSSIYPFPYTSNESIRPDLTGIVMSTHPGEPNSISASSSTPSTPLGRNSGYVEGYGDVVLASPSFPLGTTSFQPFTSSSPSNATVNLADLIECASSPTLASRRRLENSLGRTAAGSFPPCPRFKQDGTAQNYSDEETYFSLPQGSTGGGENFLGSLQDKKRLRGFPYPIREDAPMPGVRYAKDRNSWVAFWCERGRQNYKSFSNKKFGFERARQMAIEARVAFDKRQASEFGEPLYSGGGGGYVDDSGYLPPFDYGNGGSPEYYSEKHNSPSSNHHSYATGRDGDLHHPNFSPFNGRRGRMETPPTEEEEEGGYAFIHSQAGENISCSGSSFTATNGIPEIAATAATGGGKHRHHRGGGNGSSASNAPMNKNEYQQLASSLKNPKGVCYAPSNNTWMAYGGHGSGARMCKSFPVHKYGFYEARNLAISALSEGRRGSHPPFSSSGVRNASEALPQNFAKRSKADESVGASSLLLPTAEGALGSVGNFLLKGDGATEEEFMASGAGNSAECPPSPSHGEEVTLSSMGRKRGARAFSNQRRLLRRSKEREPIEDDKKINGTEDGGPVFVSPRFGCSYYDAPADAWICSYRDVDDTRRTKRFPVSDSNGCYETAKKLAECFLRSMQTKYENAFQCPVANGTSSAMDGSFTTKMGFSSFEGDEGSDVSSQMIVTRSKRGTVSVEEGEIGNSAISKEKEERERSREPLANQDAATASASASGKPLHVKGVNFNRQCNTWAAIWYVTGVQQVKYFSVKQYGYDEARRLAIEHRQKIDATKLRNALRETKQSVGGRQQSTSGATRVPTLSSIDVGKEPTSSTSSTMVESNATDHLALVTSVTSSSATENEEASHLTASPSLNEVRELTLAVVSPPVATNMEGDSLVKHESVASPMMEKSEVTFSCVPETSVEASAFTSFQGVTPLTETNPAAFVENTISMKSSMCSDVSQRNEASASPVCSL